MVVIPTLDVVLLCAWQRVVCLNGGPGMGYISDLRLDNVVVVMAQRMCVLR